MVKFYAARIMAGKMTVQDVPARWRKEAAEAIKDVKGGLNNVESM